MKNFILLLFFFSKSYTSEIFFDDGNIKVEFHKDENQQISFNEFLSYFRFRNNIWFVKCFDNGQDWLILDNWLITHAEILHKYIEIWVNDETSKSQIKLKDIEEKQSNKIKQIIGRINLEIFNVNFSSTYDCKKKILKAYLNIFNKKNLELLAKCSPVYLFKMYSYFSQFSK